MTTIASALLLCLPGLSISPQKVRVDIAIEGAAPPPPFVAAAIEEAADIWAAYGVKIQAPDALESGHDRIVRLVVRIAPSGNKSAQSGALGSILFNGDDPAPTIELYPAAASALIAAVAFNRRDDAWPATTRDNVLARVLGRALAHEVGHFLLRSKGHSTHGLMKAEQIGSDLMAPDHRGFSLSRDEIHRFRDVLSASGDVQD
jgi:hypothetical protein